MNKIQEERKPLTPIQSSKTSRAQGGEMVGKKKTQPSQSAVVKTLFKSPTKTIKKTVKIVYCEKEVQTETSDIDLVTGDTTPPGYWKELAQQRLEALQETLKENQTLHERIADLEEKNLELEDLVEDAKKISSMLTKIADENSSVNESGIGKEWEPSLVSDDE